MNDILLDTNHDVLIQGGDFATGESTFQHIDLLVATNKGEWKENPTIAVGAAGFLKDNDQKALLVEAKIQIEQDGMDIKTLKINGDNLFVDARY